MWCEVEVWWPCSGEGAATRSDVRGCAQGGSRNFDRGSHRVGCPPPVAAARNGGGARPRSRPIRSVLWAFPFFLFFRTNLTVTIDWRRLPMPASNKIYVLIEKYTKYLQLKNSNNTKIIYPIVLSQTKYLYELIYQSFVKYKT